MGLHLNLILLVGGNVYIALLGCSSCGWLRAKHLIEVIIHIVVVVMARAVAVVHSLCLLQGLGEFEYHLNFSEKERKFQLTLLVA